VGRFTTTGRPPCPRRTGADLRPSAGVAHALDDRSGDPDSGRRRRLVEPVAVVFDRTEQASLVIGFDEDGEVTGACVLAGVRERLADGASHRADLMLVQ